MFYTSLNGSAVKEKGAAMFGKKVKDPIEMEKEELARAWAVEELDSAERQELIDRYLELDTHQLSMVSTPKRC